MTSIHKGKKEIQGNVYSLSHPKHSGQIEGDKKPDPPRTGGLTALSPTNFSEITLKADKTQKADQKLDIQTSNL